MPFLARKISRAKWKEPTGCQGGEIQSDIYTTDLKSLENSLSFWRIDSGDKEEVDKVILAIATGWDRFDKFVVALIDEAEFDSIGIDRRNTPGDTAVAHLKNSHVDLVQLDTIRIGKVAELIMGSLNSNNYSTYRAPEVKQVLLNAIDSQLVARDQLKDSLQRELVKDPSAKN